MEDVITMVNKNTEGRKVVSGYFLKDDEAQQLWKQGKENDSLRALLIEAQREQLQLKILIVAVCLILVAACIAGVMQEAMSSTLAWAMGLPTCTAGILCCLPKAKEEEA